MFDRNGDKGTNNGDGDKGNNPFDPTKKYSEKQNHGTNPIQSFLQKSLGLGSGMQIKSLSHDGKYTYHDKDTVIEGRIEPEKVKQIEYELRKKAVASILESKDIYKVRKVDGEYHYSLKEGEGYKEYKLKLDEEGKKKADELDKHMHDLGLPVRNSTMSKHLEKSALRQEILKSDEHIKEEDIDKEINKRWVEGYDANKNVWTIGKVKTETSSNGVTTLKESVEECPGLEKKSIEEHARLSIFKEIYGKIDGHDVLEVKSTNKEGEYNVRYGNNEWKTVNLNKTDSEKLENGASVDKVAFKQNAFFDNAPPENDDLKALEDRLKKAKRWHTAAQYGGLALASFANMLSQTYGQNIEPAIGAISQLQSQSQEYTQQQLNTEVARMVSDHANRQVNHVRREIEHKQQETESAVSPENTSKRRKIQETKKSEEAAPPKKE
jgi:hypothetical protein